MKAINGDDLLRRVNFLLATIYTPELVEILKALKEYLEKAPTLTLDDLRPKGRWVMRGGKLYCSHCGERACVTRDKEDFWYTKGTHICPSCVADMRGGGEDG